MNRLNKILLAFSGVCVILLCVSVLKCSIYKQEINKLKENEKVSNGLTPVDCMVISGRDEAYLNCNSMYSGNIFHHGENDTIITDREYLLYCYIFAIRDHNPFAAAEFSSYCMKDMSDGNMKSDTAMLRVVSELLLQILSSTSNSTSNFIKWLAATKLEEIYSGTLCEETKDTLLFYKYGDMAKRYASYR